MYSARGRWGWSSGSGERGKAEYIEAGWAATAEAGKQQSGDPGKGAALSFSSPAGPCQGSKPPSAPLCTSHSCRLGSRLCTHSDCRRMGLHPSPTPAWCHCLSCSVLAGAKGSGLPARPMWLGRTGRGAEGGWAGRGRSPSPNWCCLLLRAELPTHRPLGHWTPGKAQPGGERGNQHASGRGREEGRKGYKWEGDHAGPGPRGASSGVMLVHRAAGLA